MQDASFAPPIAFFHTLAMPCPYVDGRVERRLVADLSSRRGRMSHDVLARAGFRRTQHLCYRPACPSCDRCIPIRVRVGDFDWTRSARRAISRNSDLQTRAVPAKATREHFDLFRRYQSGRHGDGEMALMDLADYADMVERSPIETSLIEHRDGMGRVVAVMLMDVQDDGLSAVYSFFEPDEASRGLGTFMVLDLVRHCVAVGLPYLYLGYWIPESRKMAYKARFRPTEVLRDGRWVELAEAEI